MENNWKFLYVPSDQSGSTVFVTKGDANDAQLELTLASHCPYKSAFCTNNWRKNGMRRETSSRLGIT